MRRRFLAGLLLLAAWAAAQSATTATSSAETVRQAQLRRGQQTYIWSCAICHGDNAQGLTGPALSGPDFAAQYGPLPLSLHHFIRDVMPENQPGTLSEQEVMDVTAYLLDFSGLDIPDTGLTLERLETPLLLKP